MITAPYNFVPLSGWVYQPAWANEVSHDKPFKDGLCGHLEIKITADTPILVGGSQAQAGCVDCFQLPDDTYAIPGASLKGMVRNVLEIATFGKMQFVDNQRLSLRDISSGRVKQHYAEKMHTGRKAGFMKLRPATQESTEEFVPAEIIPCDFVHVHHQALEAYLGIPPLDEPGQFTRPQLFTKQNTPTIQNKYDAWANRATDKPYSERNLPSLSFDIANNSHTSERHASSLGHGSLQGELVLTGQISDKSQVDKKGKRHGKYRDFVFYKERPADTTLVSKEVLFDFLQIHGEDRYKKNPEADNLPWSYWRTRFFNEGLSIPVFYHEHNDKVSSIGLAYMYRLAYDNSIGEVVDKHSGAHRNEAVYDLAELMFGTIKTADSLRSRVNFGMAKANGQPTPETHDDTILNGPKPSYFPNYVCQTDNELLKSYTTYMNATRLRIRGWKRYPARPFAQVQALTQEQMENKKTQVSLHPLPKGTCFTAKVRFHNLRPVELGALYWVLTWGEKEDLRHTLGMGKPFSFGQIKIDIVGWDIRPNDPNNNEFTLKDCMMHFCNNMEDAYKEAQAIKSNQGWIDSEQLAQLFAMANPQHEKATPKTLKHMQLTTTGNNEFLRAKQAGWVLPNYDTNYLGIDEDKIIWKSHEDIQTQREAAREAAKKAAEIAANREKMTPLEKELDEIRVANPNNYLSALYKALVDEGRWDGKKDEKEEVVKEVESEMREADENNWKWREKSAKRRPEKDTAYQRTLVILNMLKDTSNR